MSDKFADPIRDEHLWNQASVKIFRGRLRIDLLRYLKTSEEKSYNRQNL